MVLPLKILLKKYARSGKEELKERSIVALNAKPQNVQGPTGKIISSENSLNQHLKLKHVDLWKLLKPTETKDSFSNESNSSSYSRGQSLI